MTERKGKIVCEPDYDAFTGWKKVLRWHAGQRARIKRAYSKRQRAQARLDCRRRQREY